ncbi:MAG: nickel pincer cofactor biosynthesis protein LarC [Oscillospiraceae bacterium]|nr:nickel pincer cofactor biosynthesis protein LarC [Oscillospiraceae bacterium]
MKTLYLDCGMGAAGDMLSAALLGLMPDRAAVLEELNRALGGLAVVTAEEVTRCGVCGLHVKVDIAGDEEGEAIRHPHANTSIGALRALLAAAPVSDKVRADATAVFDLLAQAEADVHGVEMENVHFHEVGSIDAVADVLGVCLLVEKLAPERILASPVCVGGGTVKCAHGVLPVPAPATERLLRGIPWYAGSIESELCTPTGAALLRHFVGEFAAMPPMLIEGCGYGMGKKEFPRLNALRAFWGESEGETEELCELACNLDDMTGEEIGFALDRLFAAGALDAWTSPIGMKKSRPGVLLSCLCREEKREALLRCFFRHTTTLGVRERRCLRTSLGRMTETAHTPYGEVRVKVSQGWGVERRKAEFDDLAALARENGLSLREIKDSIE